MSPHKLDALSVLRNQDFISPAVQQALAERCILIAGCGSTGGSIIEPLVRTGARRLILADNGTYEETNLNRQAMTLADVDRNKAAVHAERVLAIVPHCQVRLETGGILPENVAELTGQADLIIDGVDVTSPEGLLAKYRLHQQACAQRKLVITGYDMAATQHVVVHDYRRAGEPVLGGRLNEDDIRQLPPLTACVKLIGPQNMPLEIFEELQRHHRGEKQFVSQLAMTANLFGVLALGLVLKALANEALPPAIYLDVWELLGHYSPAQREALARQRQYWSEQLSPLPA